MIWLHNIVNVLQATELYMLKMIKAVNFREIEREWGRPTLEIVQPSKFTDEKTQTHWGKVICQLIIGTARLDPDTVEGRLGLKWED